MQSNILKLLEKIDSRLSTIEKNINRLDEKLDFSITLQRNHLIRVKNQQEIDDSMILYGRPYNDLSPQRAFQIYHNADIDFIVLDVSHEEYEKENRFPDAICIPLEELNERFREIISQTIPILVISEKGLRSIKACEILIKKGFFNLNNISGGHQFWPRQNIKVESTPA